MKRVLKSSLSLLLAITIIFSSAYVGLSEVDFEGLFAVNPFKELIVKSEAVNTDSTDTETSVPQEDASEANKEVTENNNESTGEEYTDDMYALYEEIVEANNEYLNNATVGNEYIYYTDLFYGYPYYLENDPFFDSYSLLFSNMNDTVYNAYKNSPLIVGTGLENALDTITSPTQITKLITDVFGLTDFSYNDALDAANDEFVHNILSESITYNAEKSFGKVSSVTKKLNELVGFFNALEEVGGIDNTAEYYAKEAFKYLTNEGVLNFLSESAWMQLWNEINSKDFKLSSCFSLATTEIDIAKAILTAVLLEDVRVEIIDDIIATQDSNTVLKQGMTRLKSKLQGGFVSRFIENYLEKKLIDTVLKKVDKLIVGAITPDDFKALVKIAKAVFEVAVDVPTVELILKWQVLMCYSNDLSSSISGLASYYSQNAFSSNEILKYENLFIAYDAANKAALDVTEKIAGMLNPFGEAYAVLVEARNNNVETVTITTGGTKITIPSTTTDEELYDILTRDSFNVSNGVISLVKVVTVSNGTTTVTVKRKLNHFAVIIQGCINQSWEKINNFNSAYGDISLFGEHIRSVREAIYNTPVNERIVVSDEVCQNRVFNFNSSTQLAGGSDTVEPGCIYCVNDVLFGSLKVSGKKVVDEDLQIMGSISLTAEYQTPSQIVFKNKANVTVNGNCNLKGSKPFNDGTAIFKINDATVTISGNMVVGDGNSNNLAEIYMTDINSVLKVYGDCLCLGYYSHSMSYGKVYLYGDFAGECTTSKDCTFYFCGTDTQKLQGEIGSAVLLNDIALSSNLIVWGSFKSEGKAISLDGYKMNLLTTDNENVITKTSGTVYIGTNSVSGTMTGNINACESTKVIFKGTVVYTGQMSGAAALAVEYGKFTISGGIHEIESISLTAEYKTPSQIVFENNANVTVNGNCNLKGSKPFNDGTAIFKINDATVTISGNMVVGDGNSNNLAEIYMTDINSVLKVYGDCLCLGYYSHSMSYGKVYLYGDYAGNTTGSKDLTVYICGSEGQTVNLNQCSTLILDNASEEGTVFSSAIKVTTLFNHKGNKFTLYNNGTGSSFVDYDGDGLKDNVDPKPTIGNLCTITVATENAEKGTVSESFDIHGGTTVTVTATPTAKYVFNCWKDANNKVVSQNAAYTFVAKSDTKLTAYFTKRQRNISVNTVNGTLTVPSKAEIESTVTITPVPNEGCVYTADSITVNGEAITGNSFIMPDEDVTLSAHFYVNEYYFALKDVLVEAKEINQSLYSSKTVSVLQTAIANAQKSLVNDVSQEESNARIEELQSAINNLIFIKGDCGESLAWSYDEETKTLIITGTGDMFDYVDSDSPWKSLCEEISCVDISRGITSIGDDAFSNFILLSDVYYRYTEESWNSLPIGANNECLTSANIHCHIHNFVGSVTLNPTCIELGETTYNCDCGDIYTESMDALGHDFSTQWTIDKSVTCTTDGSKSHHCTRCDEITDVTVISATGHTPSVDWEIVEPTCTDYGSKTRNCTVCGEITENIETEPIGHNMIDAVCQNCGFGSEWQIQRNSDGLKIIGYIGSDSNVVIPGSLAGLPITSIGDNAFRDNYNLTSIVIPDSVTSIGKEAFSCCGNLSSITFPEGLVSIGYAAFCWSGLTSISIPDGVTSIGEEAFCGCLELNEVVLGSGITSINDYTFSDCFNLSSLTVCGDLANIGESAFSFCDNLKYIFFAGSAENFGNITIAVNNIPLYNASIHYNANAHVYIEKFDAEATCTQNGSRHKECNVCGYSIDFEEIPAIGHTYSTEWTIDDAPTCTEEGSKSHHCTHCGELTDVTIISATGHNYVAQSTEFDHPHIVTYKCSLCEDIKAETPIAPDCVECIEEVKGLVQETSNAVIDYEKFIIRTSVENVPEITDIIALSDNARVTITPSYKYGDVEIYGTGTIIIVFDGNEFVCDFTLVVEGDTNGDSVVDALDAAQVANASNGLKALDGAYAMAADSNSDDEISIEDYQAIVNKAVS